MRIDRATILSLIPHQGTMCLHDEVVEWTSEKLRLRSAGHRHADHPLRLGEQLHAVHLCEYGAQAMAVHGGLIARATGARAAPGFLVSLRDVVLECARIDDLEGHLITEAERLLESESSWQYAFRIYHHDRLLASGRAAVMLRAPDQSTANGVSP